MAKIIPLRRTEMHGESDGGGPEETRVSLCIYHEQLDPEAVSARLECRPTHSHRQGERRSEHSPPYHQGAWVLTVEGHHPNGPDELMRLLLARFPSEAEFWSQLRADYELELHVALHMDGRKRAFQLGPSALQLVAVSGIPLSFDLTFYPDEFDSLEDSIKAGPA